MKGAVTFDFDVYEDREKINRIFNADYAYGAIHEILEYFRNQIKYNDNLSEENINFLEKIKDEIYGILEDNHINLDRDYP